MYLPGMILFASWRAETGAALTKKGEPAAAKAIARVKSCMIGR